MAKGYRVMQKHLFHQVVKSHSVAKMDSKNMVNSQQFTATKMEPGVTGIALIWTIYVRSIAVNQIRKALQGMHMIFNLSKHHGHWPFSLKIKVVPTINTYVAVSSYDII